MTAILVSEQPGNREHRFELEDEQVVLGRGTDCDIVLEGSEVSRRHARITASGGTYVLEDLGSKNGTWVNGMRVLSPYTLADGESILFGDRKYRLYILDATTMTTPARRLELDLMVVLFTDIVGSTEMRRHLGDEMAQDIVRTHDDIVRRALMATSGSEIKHTGDGIMASFASVTEALDCARAVQQSVAKFVEQYPDKPLAVYVGLNAGEPIRDGDDIFGTAVDLAKRLCDHAAPGQIVASNVVKELAAGKGAWFSEIGRVATKGFDDPVLLYEVKW